MSDAGFPIPRTIFIGDVHGCAAELALLLGRLQPTAADRLIQVGDLFTKGPDPVGVWALVEQHRIEPILGNHDESMRVLLTGEPGHVGRSAERAVEKLRLGGVKRSRLRAFLNALPLTLTGTALAGPHSGRRWRTVHAGVDPRRGFSGTDREQLITMRNVPAALDRGAARDELRHRWHRRWSGDELIVFGHDAVGGLVEARDGSGRRTAVGLDSGCVYGGRLSAFVLETDALIQQPALAIYQPV